MLASPARGCEHDGMADITVRRVDFGYFVRPAQETGLREALAAIGTGLSDIGLAANCHLHFDHCGGNPALGQIPVFVQGAELDNARHTQDYTLPELIEGSRFEQVTGEAEMLPGIYLMPTPGHTSGHQSLIVRRADGAVIVAGKATTPRRNMPPTSSPGEPTGTVIVSRCPASRRGSMLSSSSIPGSSASPTTARSGPRETR